MKHVVDVRNRFYVDVYEDRSSQTYIGTQKHALLLFIIMKKHGIYFYLKHDGKFRL